jgi:hypothetical protein
MQIDRTVPELARPFSTQITIGGTRESLLSDICQINSDHMDDFVSYVYSSATKGVPRRGDKRQKARLYGEANFCVHLIGLPSPLHH